MCRDTQAPTKCAVAEHGLGEPDPNTVHSRYSSTDLAVRMELTPVMVRAPNTPTTG
jgi:hypothetical protein